MLVEASRILWITGRIALLDQLMEERWQKLIPTVEEEPKSVDVFAFHCACGKSFTSKLGRSKHLNWTKGLCNKLDGQTVGADLGTGTAPVLASDLDDVGARGIVGMGGEGGGLVGGPDDAPADGFLR